MIVPGRFDYRGFDFNKFKAQTELISVSLGEEAIRTFIAKLFEHPTPDSRGWSDLSVFHQGQYIPIEVKGSDKLTYPQIERLYWLKNNVPEYAKNQRVSQILLC
jgi:hypothetical protein